MMGGTMITTLALCNSATLPRLLRRVLSAACVALSACASQPLVGQYAPPNGACCATVADVNFSPLALGKEVDFSLAPNTPTLKIEERQGHVAGFSVPSGFVATTAAVKSYVSTGYLPNATAVAPELHFFDAQFRPVGKAAVGDMRSDNGFWRASVSGRVAVPFQTRYIVVMATKGEAGRGLVRSDNGTPYLLPPAALGDLSIRLFGQEAAR